MLDAEMVEWWKVLVIPSTTLSSNAVHLKVLTGNRLVIRKNPMRIQADRKHCMMEEKVGRPAL